MRSVTAQFRDRAAYAWVVVAALWPVAMLNYLDRQMIATIRTSMRADIPSIANDQDFGTLMAVFLAVYALLSPLGGLVADRFNRRWTVVGSLFVWSAVTWLTGHMHTYHQMLVCRGLMGISEACYIPAALALIADYHSGNTQARAVGVHQSGIYAGMALGGIGGYIAQTSSWRNCFTWFGAAGVIYALLLAAILRDAPTTAGGRRADAPRVTLGHAVRTLGREPSYWILVLYFTLMGIAGWAAKNWMPTFLADRFSLTEGPAGLSATGYIHVASFLGVLAGGVMADRWMRRTPRGQINTSSLGSLLLLPALLGLSAAWNLDAAIVCLVLFGVGWGFYDCANMPILCQIIPAELRATGYGLMNLASIGVGAGVTIVLGWMRDQGISFTVAFIACGGIALACAGLIRLIRLRAAEAPVNDLYHVCQPENPAPLAGERLSETPSPLAGEGQG
jgi:MFS family permease